MGSTIRKANLDTTSILSLEHLWYYVIMLDFMKEFIIFKVIFSLSVEE